MKRPRVEVVIDELVLHGFEAKNRHAVGHAFERELGRLFAGGLASSERSAAAIDAGSVTVPHGAGALHAGAEVARAVHRGVTS